MSITHYLFIYTFIVPLTVLIFCCFFWHFGVTCKNYSFFLFFDIISVVFLLYFSFIQFIVWVVCIFNLNTWEFQEVPPKIVCQFFFTNLHRYMGSLNIHRLLLFAHFLIILVVFFLFGDSLHENFYHGVFLMLPLSSFKMLLFIDCRKQWFQIIPKIVYFIISFSKLFIILSFLSVSICMICNYDDAKSETHTNTRRLFNLRSQKKKQIFTH